MNTTINITALSMFVFLGVFMGIMLSFFFILKRSQNSELNRFRRIKL
jgi:hypothetical protein